MRCRVLFRAFPILACLCLVFCSCQPSGFTDALSCIDISKTLTAEISGASEFSSCTAEELEYMLGEPVYFDDHAVLYSTDGTNVSEIGVLHASDRKNAQQLLRSVELYLERLKEEKSDFLRNYAPEELSKLEGASVGKYGNYVIFTVLPRQESQLVLNKALNMLKKEKSAR